MQDCFTLKSISLSLKSHECALNLTDLWITSLLFVLKFINGASLLALAKSRALNIYAQLSRHSSLRDVPVHAKKRFIIETFIHITFSLLAKLFCISWQVSDSTVLCKRNANEICRNQRNYANFGNQISNFRFRTLSERIYHASCKFSTTRHSLDCYKPARNPLFGERIFKNQYVLRANVKQVYLILSSVIRSI